MKERVLNMKPSVDNTPPTTRRSGPNTKRLQVMEERYSRIEHENRLLLARMSEILVKPGGDNSYSQVSQHSYASRGQAPPTNMQRGRRSRSLNNSGKKLELARITRDNLALLGRLQQVKPVLDRQKWALDASANDKLVASISEYKRSSALLYGKGSMYSAADGQPVDVDGRQDEDQQLQQQQQPQQRGRLLEAGSTGGVSIAGRGGSLDRSTGAIGGSVGPLGLPGFSSFGLTFGGSGAGLSAGIPGGSATTPFTYSLPPTFPSFASTGGAESQLSLAGALSSPGPSQQAQLTTAMGAMRLGGGAPASGSASGTAGAAFGQGLAFHAWSG